MRTMPRKRTSLKRYWRYATQDTTVHVDLQVHDLLVGYAASNGLTLREAANKIISAGLAVELERYEARKAKKDTERLLKED